MKGVELTRPSKIGAALVSAILVAGITGGLWWVYDSVTAYPELPLRGSSITISYPERRAAEMVGAEFYDAWGDVPATVDLYITLSEGNATRAESPATITLNGPSFTDGTQLRTGCQIKFRSGAGTCKVESNSQIITAVIPPGGLSIEVPRSWTYSGYKTDIFSLPEIRANGIPSAPVPTVDAAEVYILLARLHSRHGADSSSNSLTPSERLDNVDPAPQFPGTLFWTVKGGMNVGPRGTITDVSADGLQGRIVFVLGVLVGLLPLIAGGAYKICLVLQEAVGRATSSRTLTEALSRLRPRFRQPGRFPAPRLRWAGKKPTRPKRD